MTCPWCQRPLDEHDETTVWGDMTVILCDSIPPDVFEIRP